LSFGSLNWSLCHEELTSFHIIQTFKIKEHGTFTAEAKKTVSKEESLMWECKIVLELFKAGDKNQNILGFLVLALYRIAGASDGPLR
jgi:hypothetical protein